MCGQDIKVFISQELPVKFAAGMAGHIQGTQQVTPK